MTTLRQTLDWKQLLRWFLLAVFIVMALVIAILIPVVVGLSSSLDATRHQVSALGGTPVAPPAASVRANPQLAPSAGEGQPGAAGPAGAPASDGQVRAAVAAYFAAHPVSNGRTPSAVDIAAAVANYLSAHPPAAGPAGQDATPDQVSGAVASYLSNPQVQDQLRGPTGSAGADVTPEQVAAAVKTYMQDHPLPTCPDGTTAKAVSVVTSDPAGTTKIVACVVDEPTPAPSALLLLPMLVAAQPRRAVEVTPGAATPTTGL